MKAINIALDGPSGSGKSTVAKLVAKKYGIVYIDTGALYRTVGHAVRINGIDSKDQKSIINLLPKINISMKLIDGGNAVFLDGNRLGNEIRTDIASKYASDVSAIPEVRKFLFSTQRDIAHENDCIMDGRDIGTVILPEADVKIFLTASDKVRAERRYKELNAKGENVTFDDVYNAMLIRDSNDSHRAEAPAVPAQDAVILDTSELNLDGVLDAVSAIIESKTPLR